MNICKHPLQNITYTARYLTWPVYHNLPCHSFKLPALEYRYTLLVKDERILACYSQHQAYIPFCYCALQNREFSTTFYSRMFPKLIETSRMPKANSIATHTKWNLLDHSWQLQLTLCLQQRNKDNSMMFYSLIFIIT